MNAIFTPSMISALADAIEFENALEDAFANGRITEGTDKLDQAFDQSIKFADRADRLASSIGGMEGLKANTLPWSQASELIAQRQEGRKKAMAHRKRRIEKEMEIQRMIGELHAA